MGVLDDARAAKARVDEDWAEAQRQIAVLTNSVAQLGQLVDEAAALDVTQNAEIDSLKAERDQLVADANAAKEVLDGIDPDASFPAPVDTGGGDTGGGETGGGETGGTNPEPPPTNPDVGTGTTPDTPPPPPEVIETPPEIGGGEDTGGGEGGTVNPTPGEETPNP